MVELNGDHVLERRQPERAGGIKVRWDERITHQREGPKSQTRAGSRHEAARQDHDKNQTRDEDS